MRYILSFCILGVHTAAQQKCTRGEAFFTLASFGGDSTLSCGECCRARQIEMTAEIITTGGCDMSRLILWKLVCATRVLRADKREREREKS